ncbi:nuclear transport factor 2 family protein [Kutzneria sp. NPDC051319]|uniref:nuclear transport factor 2 family protein n=1 Tax=Kutzneria sp. NPDC051319 TaxID=3155047 RepID=UPI00344049D5
MTETELAQLVAALSDRLGRLEDVEAIKKLHRSYVRSLADREWTDLLDSFTEDAVVDLSERGLRRGRAELAELFDAMGEAGHPHDGYVLSSPIIDVDGDEATGSWTLHRHRCEFPAMGATVRVFGPWWEGRYECSYRYVGGRWRFAAMTFRLVAPDSDGEAAAPTPVHGASHAG